MTIRGLVTCDLRLANTTSLVTSEATPVFAVARVCASDGVGAAPLLVQGPRVKREIRGLLG